MSETESSFYTKYLSYKSTLFDCMIKHFDKFRSLSSDDSEIILLQTLRSVGKKNKQLDISIIKILSPSIFKGDALMSDTAEFIVFHLRNKWTREFQRNLKPEENELLDQFRKQL